MIGPPPELPSAAVGNCCEAPGTSRRIFAGTGLAPQPANITSTLRVSRRTIAMSSCISATRAVSCSLGSTT